MASKIQVSDITTGTSSWYNRLRNVQKKIYTSIGSTSTLGQTAIPTITQGSTIKATEANAFITALTSTTLKNNDFLKHADWTKAPGAVSSGASASQANITAMLGEIEKVCSNYSTNTKCSDCQDCTYDSTNATTNSTYTQYTTQTTAKNSTYTQGDCARDSQNSNYTDNTDHTNDITTTNSNSCKTNSHCSDTWYAEYLECTYYGNNGDCQTNQTCQTDITALYNADCDNTPTYGNSTYGQNGDHSDDWNDAPQYADDWNYPDCYQSDHITQSVCYQSECNNTENCETWSIDGTACSQCWDEEHSGYYTEDCYTNYEYTAYSQDETCHNETCRNTQTCETNSETPVCQTYSQYNEDDCANYGQDCPDNYTNTVQSTNTIHTQRYGECSNCKTNSYNPPSTTSYSHNAVGAQNSTLTVIS